MASPRICSVEGCGKKHYGKGWCSAHYSRWRRYGDPRSGGAPRGVAAEFYRHVVLHYDGDECLFWPHSRDGHGYARLCLGGIHKSVCRLICEKEFGAPPGPEFDAAHSCGKGHLGCVARSHLSWKSRSQNQMDRVAHGTSNRGERCGTSKITESDARRISAMKGKRSQNEIAREFGISQSTVSRIHSEEIWFWLDDDQRRKYMSLKIDGYVGVDKEIALEQGVDFSYEMDFGSIFIRSKTLNLRDNPQFAMAFKGHQEWLQRRQRLSSKVSDDDAGRRFLALIHDHGVIEWSTTIKSGGKRIEPTRENFIDLLMTDACQSVAVVYFQDACDEAHFRAVSPEDDAKNSGTPSAGKSGGRGGAKNS